MPGTHTSGKVIPIFTQRTCTEPTCDGTCGRQHPNGTVTYGDGGEAA